MSEWHEFDIDPCPAPRMTKSDRWKKRPVVMKYFAFRDEFILQANVKGYTLQPEIEIFFIIAMPESWSEKKKKAMDGQPHQTKPDWDNLSKGICDSFGKDDGFVWKADIEKRWGRKGKILIKKV